MASLRRTISHRSDHWWGLYGRIGVSASAEESATQSLIAALRSQNFRALENTLWELDSGSHLLLGGTGEGKTSLLEAIYLAATTRSFRTSRLSDCLRAGGEPAADSMFVSIDVANTVRARLDVSWRADTGLERRLNGDRAALEEHLGQQPVLAFSAADVEVLVGAPELRRRLIDRVSVALDPNSLKSLSTYRKALDHKRALLVGRRPVDRDALRSFNVMLAESAARLIGRREATIELLSEALTSVTAEFPRRGFNLGLRYRCSPLLGDEPSQDAVLEALESAVESELRTHRPALGPHRDRIEVLFRGRPVAETASAGERKAIALLLLAAQERVLRHASRPCVLLIDDVDTEMDQPTLEAIFPLLVKGPQTLFSSNREAVFDQVAVDRIWDVRDGAIERR